MSELEKRNRKYISLQVSDIPKTILILERQFHVKDYSVQVNRQCKFMTRH